MEWAASRIPALLAAAPASSSSSPLASPTAVSPSPLQHAKPGLAAELGRAGIRQSHASSDSRFFQDLLLCECGDELHPADRELHVETECPLRMVQCTRPGCKQLFQANQKLQHDQTECLVARHSRKLLQAKEDGDALAECEICHDERYPIRKRDLQRHQLCMCVKRVVTCRFAERGCVEKFSSDEQEIHEAHRCVVAKRREQIAADALLVNEETECDWCKQVVKKRHLLDHQEDECLERERPCPNAVNGCKEWAPVGKLDEHIRTNCSVTLERNALAARAREKNTPMGCKERGLSMKLRHLDRHWREDFMALSRDRSMLEFQTGGKSYIAVQMSHSSSGGGGGGSDLAPPWTAEYFVWLVDADDEILDLLKVSLLQLEAQVANVRENQRWLAQSEACKKRLKELKQLRKQKSSGNSAKQEEPQKQKLTGAELSAAAKDLADEFNASEIGVLTTQKAVNLAKGWIQTERLRRRYERELGKVDAKLAIVSENTATELLERRGRHVIASSSKNAISLVAGTPAQLRNQWSHVALSASKKELSLFLNGELKAIKRGEFDLPLSFIGAHDSNDNGTSSFQGFVQEIRYWKECRSAKQLQQFANSILQVPKCRERLVAYWTLEEGMDELVDDMALLLPRSPCFHTNWVLYDTPAIRKRFGIPPTPSLRDKTCCIVNQKLKELARDRERDVASCRQHCEEKEIPLQQLDAHHRLVCTNRMVACKEIGCGQVYRFADELQHLSASCERHLFREKLFRRYQEKEELESCLLNCGLAFKKRHSQVHYHSECVNRLVRCPRLDCQETIVAKTLAVHLAKDCRSQEQAVQRRMVENARKRLKEKQQLLMSHGQVPLPPATDTNSQSKTKQ